MKGYIYKIQPTVEHQPEEVYIGSTTKTLNERLQKHKYSYSRYLNGKDHNTSVFKLFDKYGLDNFDIILLEEIDFNDKKELTNLEGVYIKNNNCINRKIEGRTKKEWYNDNINSILEYQKQYRDNNKINIKELKKEHYNNNKNIILENQKEYYNKNKVKINNQQNQKHICNICNCNYTYANKSRHYKSLKHQQALNNHQPVININIENVIINN
jgi:hypothetical protein